MENPRSLYQATRYTSTPGGWTFGTVESGNPRAFTQQVQRGGDELPVFVPEEGQREKLQMNREQWDGEQQEENRQIAALLFCRMPAPPALDWHTQGAAAYWMLSPVPCCVSKRISPKADSYCFKFCSKRFESALA